MRTASQMNTLMKRSMALSQRPSAVLLATRGARIVPSNVTFPPLSDARAFSSSADEPKKELSAFQKLQKWMQPFVHGSKALFLENKQAWQIRSRVKAGGKDAQLTRQEMMVLRQAHRDLVKSLPLLAFFAIPLVGYAAPLIGYQFPKQLLPWQFWRPDQKTEFFRADAEAKAAFYPELVKLLTQMDNKDKMLKELLASKEGLNPAQVSEFSPFFGTEGPAHLSKLSSKHVHTLTRAVALYPAFSALTQYIPAAYLQQHLAKHANELRVDDLMLLKEGIDALSLSELEFACEERGIVGGYGDIEALRSALREWLTLYDTDHTDAKPLPASLLLHAPALVRFSEKKTFPKCSRHTRSQRGNGRTTSGNKQKHNSRSEAATSMESRLPAPPPSMATSRSHSSSATLEPSKLPLPSRRRSWLQSEEDVSSSASTTSSPEVAVANSTTMVAPPRLKLHDLAAHGSEQHARVASTCSANAPGRQVLPDAADAFLVQCHQQQLMLQPGPVRTGIPSIMMKNANVHTRLTPGTTTRLQTTGMEQQPSRIGRGYEPKKKPPPPMIDTQWSSEVAVVDARGDDSEALLLPAAGSTALQSDDAIADHQANPISDHAALQSEPESTAAPVRALPVIPPPVRVPHLQVNANVQGDIPTISVAKNVIEPRPLPRSPPMVQRLKSSVEPPKTPSGGPAFEAFNDDDESKLSASQRVRMGLSVLMTHGNGNGAIVNGGDMTRRKSHEEESQRSQQSVAAPMSCPPLFQASGKQQHSTLKDTESHPSQPRGSNLIASKLLPSRMCLNTLIEYVRELNQSAASLRVELEHTRQKADKELFEAHAKVRSLQESIQRAEFEHEQAQVQFEEQEQRVRNLQAQVVTLQQQVQAAGTSQSASNFSQEEALVSNGFHHETLRSSASAAPHAVINHVDINGNEAISSAQTTNVFRIEPVTAGSQHQQEAPSVRNARSQQLILSPRYARPLWEPWSSGSDSPLTSAVSPPMFTIVPSESDLLPSSPGLMPMTESVASVSSANHDHELKSIVSPKNLIRTPDRATSRLKAPLSKTPAATENLIHPVPSYTTAHPIFSLAAVSVPKFNELQMQTAAGDPSESGNPVAPAGEMETALHQFLTDPSSTNLVTPPTVCAPQYRGDLGDHEMMPPKTASVPPNLFHPTEIQLSEKPSKLIPAVEFTAASLEKLLADFFSEFDTRKVRMAEVYGKRYAGHEHKLFAELTRRYGKGKVAVLQRRYEESLSVTQVVGTSYLHEVDHVQSLQSQDAPGAPPLTVVEAAQVIPDHAAVQYPNKLAVADTMGARQDQAMQGFNTSAGDVTNGEVSTQQVSPRGKFRPHDHGFHVPGHTELPSLPEEESDVCETDASTSYTSTDGPQLLSVATAGDGVQRGAPSTSQASEQSPPASPHRVAPQRRPTPFFPPMTSVVDLMTDASPLSTRELSFANGGGTKSSPIRRQGEPSTGHLPLFSSTLSDEKKPTVAAALLQSVSSESVEVDKTVLVKPPVAAETRITMESLLKELYKKHQPDKLRNVAQIAKEYAGKERVLVRLLRAKYGALSVKRMEENLHVLENSVERQNALAEAKSQAGVKKFVTCCALVSFASLSVGVAGLGLLNSRVCHNIQSFSRSSGMDANSAACYRLNLGLEEFELMRVPEYAGQSYPVECFCTNWMEREDAFLSSHSGGDLVELAKMLPFSRGAVTAYLVDAPVYPYYTKYAQPLIEISKEYAPVIQTALADVYEEISAWAAELQERIFSSTAPRDESEDDITRVKESATSALTKAAQASKSLLDSIQVEKRTGLESESASEETESTTAAQHENEDVGLEKPIARAKSAALVEVAVVQEGVDILHVESKTNHVDVAVDTAHVYQELPLGGSLSSQAVVYADNTALPVASAAAEDGDSNIMGEAVYVKTPKAFTSEEAAEPSASADSSPAIADNEESVDSDGDGDRTASRDILIEPDPVVALTEGSSADLAGAGQETSERGELPIEGAAEEISALLTASGTGTPDSLVKDDDGHAVDVIKLQDENESIDLSQVAAAAHDKDVSATGDADGSVVIDQAGTGEVGKSSAGDDDTKRDSSEDETSHEPTEVAAPTSASEENNMAVEAAFGPQEEDLDSDSGLVNREEDEEEDDDLDFDLDPWELLEMAERAAAAQLSTQER